MNTALYLRRSREDENNPVETLERHRKVLFDYAAKNNLTITKIYEEVVSGASLAARPQMLKMLDAVEDKEINAILCMDMQRLGRGDLQDAGALLEILKRRRVIIITPSKTIDLNNEADEDYAEFQTFFARYEYNAIRRRLRRGANAAAAEGWHMGSVPFGYERTYIQNGKPTLKEHETNADIVRMIFDLYVNRHKGTPAIADTLNSMGVLTQRGGAFRRNAITCILKNPIYTGKIVYNQERCIRKSATGTKSLCELKPESEWVIAKGKHPAIIDETTFKRAGDTLKRKTHPPFNTGKLENPLAGIIVCKNCGEKMQRRPYYDRGLEPQLLCPTKNCCRSASLGKVEELLLAGLKKEANKMRYQYTPKTDDTPGKTEREILVLATQHAKLLQQKSKLYDLLEQGIYTTDVFLQRQRELADRIKAVEMRKKAAESEQQKNSAAERVKNILPLIERIIADYHNTDATGRNQALKAIIHKVEYHREKGEWGNDFTLDIAFI